MNYCIYNISYVKAFISEYILMSMMMQNTNKKKVLFLCTSNSARSQMAETLLKHKAGDIYEVYSAGVEKGEVDARTIQALEKFDFDASELRSKHVDEFDGQFFDYVITLCEKASTECRSYPNTSKQLAWDIPDPKSRTGSHPFTTTLHELSSRLTMFLSVEKHARTKTAVNTPCTDEEDVALAHLDPIAFYKSLTDEVRLKALMLIEYHGELCVCELMEALEEDSQPKVSRNLAVLKKAHVITDRKHGQWVFYRINPALPLWAKSVIAQTTENNIPLIGDEITRLDTMQNRPDKAGFCK